MMPPNYNLWQNKKLVSFPELILADNSCTSFTGYASPSLHTESKGTWPLIST